MNPQGGHPLIWPKQINMAFRILSLKQSQHFHYLTSFEIGVSFWTGHLEKSVKVGDDWPIFAVPNIF